MRFKTASYVLVGTPKTTGTLRIVTRLTSFGCCSYVDSVLARPLLTSRVGDAYKCCSYKAPYPLSFSTFTFFLTISYISISPHTVMSSNAVSNAVKDVRRYTVPFMIHLTSSLVVEGPKLGCRQYFHESLRVALRR